MTVRRASGLGGRARLRAARWRSLGLIAVLLLPIAVDALNRLATSGGYRLAAAAAKRTAFGHALFKIEIVVSCFGPLIAGMAIDRYGVRRCLALAMILWCAVLAAGSVFASPESFPLGAPLVTSMLPGFVLTGVLVAVARTWPARRRSIVLAVLLLVYKDTRDWSHVGAKYFLRVVVGWSDAVSTIGTIGAVIVILWLVAFREPPRPSLSSDERPAKGWNLRSVVIIVWLELWLSIASRSPLYTASSFLGAWLDNLSAESIWQPILWTAAFAGSAYWSERLTGRFGSRAASRGMFISLGFAVLAASALASENERNAAVLGLIVAAGIGTASLSDFLVVDAAPFEGGGTYIGLVLTAEFAGYYFAKPLILSSLAAIGVGHTPVLVLAGLIGAVSAYLLTRRRAGAAARGAGPMPA